jgi:hypothetical protein
LPREQISTEVKSVTAVAERLICGFDRQNRRFDDRTEGRPRETEFHNCCRIGQSSLTRRQEWRAPMELGLEASWIGYGPGQRIPESSEAGLG